MTQQRFDRLITKLWDMSHEYFVEEVINLQYDKSEKTHPDVKENFREVCKSISDITKKMGAQVAYIEKLKKIKKQGGIVV
jgi:hypothetical protein